MDTTLAVALATAVAGVIGWFAKVAVAALTRPAPKTDVAAWNGHERRQTMMDMIHGQIAEHEVNCKNIANVIQRLERIEDKLDRFIERSLERKA